MSSLRRGAARAAVVALAASASVAEAQQGAGPWGVGAARVKPNGHYADVNGIHLYYEIHGGGPPLVLLHGGLGAIEMFGPNIPALAKSHRVIAVDLYGHGRTALTDRPLELPGMADDVAALLKHLGIARADLMGYSLGAAVALQTAVRHPEVVNKVVAVSTVARREAFYPEILAQQAGVNAAAADAMKQTPIYSLYSAVAPRVEDFPKLLDRVGAFLRTAPDFTQDISKITAPVMLVQGDADIVPPSHAVELFGLLGGGKRDGGWDGSGRPKSRLAILPGLTHYTIFADPALASVALAFLDEGVPHAGK